MTRHRTLCAAITFLLLLALLPTAALAANYGTGDLGGAIAARIEEALKMGVDPAKYAGLAVQQGAAVGVLPERPVQPVQPEPLSDYEKALIFATEYKAAHPNTSLYDITNNFNIMYTVAGGGLIVFEGSVFISTTEHSTDVSLPGFDTVEQLMTRLDDLVYLGLIQRIYP